MVDDGVTRYIEEARKQNIPEAEIKGNLAKNGWRAEVIEEAMGASPLTVPVAIGSHSMWDAFEHAIMFISLYVSATTLGLLLHYYVDKWVPGINKNTIYNSSGHERLINGYYAALIVAFPVFLVLFLQIARKTKINPAIKDLHSRKKLIYSTLVATFVIVLSNLISIIYGFLNGNVTINFLLHFLVTVGISGAIFSYYLGQIKQDKKF